MRISLIIISIIHLIVERIIIISVTMGPSIHCNSSNIFCSIKATRPEKAFFSARRP